MSVGSRIKKLRNDKNISQEELASAINVSRQIVSKWENDNTIPDSYNIKLLCDYFNTSADYILMGEEKETHNKIDKTPLFILISSYVISLALIVFSIVSYSLKLNSKDMKVGGTSSMVEIPYEIILLIIGIIILASTTIIFFKYKKKA